MTAKQVKKGKGAVSYALKLLLALVFISPVIICVVFAIQPESEISSLVPHFIPENPTLYNFIEVFKRIPVFTYMKNSFVVCFVTIGCQILFASLAAYAFTFFQFHGKKLIFTLIITTMMIPGDIVIITNFIQIQHWGLNNTYLGMVLPYLISGTAVFLMRQSYMSLPKELKEAATVDGCGDIRFLIRIAIPLTVPSMISLALYLFVTIYNQYFWPLLVTNEKGMRTIQIGMAMLLQGESTQYGFILAGALICMLPAVIVFIIGQDYIIKGMTAGALKG